VRNLGQLRNLDRSGLPLKHRLNVRRGIERYLNTCIRHAGVKKAGQDLLHLVRCASLRIDLDGEANGKLLFLSESALIQDEHALVLHPPEVWKDARQLWEAGELLNQIQRNRIGPTISFVQKDLFERFE